MNKTIRILIAIILMPAILFLARGQIAWAGPRLTSARAETITEPGTYEIGEDCRLNVTQLAEGISLIAEVLPFDSLGAHPDDIGTYLSGVCHLTYSKDGTEIPDLPPADGEVEVCLAASSTTDGKVHIYDEVDYIHLAASTEPGWQCAEATKSGKYFLADPREGELLQGPSQYTAPSTSDEPGSVKPPPAEVPGIGQPGTYSVGGVCVVRVIRLAENVNLTANLHPYEDLTGFEQKDGDPFLAGVCHVTYFKDGEQISDLAAADGEVNICFAGVPNTEGRMHVFDEETYTHLETWTEGSLVCSGVPKTGKYFVAGVQ